MYDHLADLAALPEEKFSAGIHQILMHSISALRWVEPHLIGLRSAFGVPDLHPGGGSAPVLLSAGITVTVWQLASGRWLQAAAGGGRRASDCRTCQNSIRSSRRRLNRPPAHLGRRLVSGV